MWGRGGSSQGRGICIIMTDLCCWWGKNQHNTVEQFKSTLPLGIPTSPLPLEMKEPRGNVFPGTAMICETSTDVIVHSLRPRKVNKG